MHGVRHDRPDLRLLVASAEHRKANGEVRLRAARVLPTIAEQDEFARRLRQARRSGSANGWRVWPNTVRRLRVFVGALGNDAIEFCGLVPALRERCQHHHRSISVFAVACPRHTQELREVPSGAVRSHRIGEPAIEFLALLRRDRLGEGPPELLPSG